MKKVLVYNICLVFIFKGYSQKKLIGNEINNSNWPVINAPFSLSDNGKFCAYSYYDGKLRTFVSSTDGNHRQEIGSCSNIRFALNDQKLICIKGSDSLMIFDLESQKSEYYFPVYSYNVNEAGPIYTLCFKIGNNLILRNLKKQYGDTIMNVGEYLISSDGSMVACVNGRNVKVIDSSENIKTIYNNGAPSDLVFDKSGRQLAFNIASSDTNTIYYYDTRIGFSKALVYNHSKGINLGLSIAKGQLSFNEKGNRLFFTLHTSTTNTDRDNSLVTSMVDIWHYKDNFFQSQQLKSLQPLTTFRATKLINSDTVVQLENEFAKISGKVGNHYAMVSTETNTDDAHWRKDQIPQYALVRLDNGLRTEIPRTGSKTYCNLSPGEKFVTWLDNNEELVCYEIATGKLRSLSNDIYYPICRRWISRNLGPTLFSEPKWLLEDEALLISDDYDIWMIDPFGMKKATNITERYGRNNGIFLRFIQDDLPIVSRKVILTGIDDKMNNGFFKLSIQTRSSIIATGKMDPVLYYYPGTLSGVRPVKARNADMYLLTRQTSEQAPVLLCTRNFEEFNIIDSTTPSKDYNWLTTELIHWPMPGGNTGTGILYRPENFDSTKTYPVIFNCYEERSRELHIYKNPSLSSGDLNIPWYVSNGYLVFVPDIIHPTGKTGEAAVNTVCSAAEYLSTLPFVKDSKIGIQGHSFGGYETLFVITQSNLFAAAQSSGAPSNLLSLYGGINFGDRSLIFTCETGQLNLGKSPWADRELYIRNSPIFFAERVQTPLMMVQNKEDDAVPFSQGVEMYTALRRLEKRVWMLQYDNEHHVIWDKTNQMDYTIRQQQFFNHYLKGLPAPLWMVVGIDAKNKGIKSGLQLDSLERIP